ncbi:MAG: TlpA family protein disulfide reductase [Allorhizobium sp.]
MTSPTSARGEAARYHAPELAVSEWFNTPTPISLSSLIGRPILLHTFQALCPGCVTDAIPQVKRIEQVFGRTDLAVVGLHTVFEHHQAMSPTTLKAFLYEYRITSPVGVDLADDDSDIPVTMQRYRFRGTPSSVLIGRDGCVIHQSFGVETDLLLGARIAMALSETVSAKDDNLAESTGCATGLCEARASG